MDTINRNMIYKIITEAIRIYPIELRKSNSFVSLVPFVRSFMKYLVRKITRAKQQKLKRTNHPTTLYLVFIFNKFSEIYSDHFHASIHTLYQTHHQHLVLKNNLHLNHKQDDDL